MKPSLFFLMIILLLGISSCEPKNQFIDPATPSPGSSDQAGEPTAVGQPIGTPVTKTIGSDGGSLTSSDGKLTLTIPAGALTKATPISVEPVENTASLGIGTGYHFLPEGTQFAKPVTFQYRYTDDDLNGVDVAHLGIANQQADHSWAMTHRATLNETQHTITTQIQHFSWWSLVTQYKLAATRSEVIPAAKTDLYLQYCPTGFDDSSPTSVGDVFTGMISISKMADVRVATVNGVPWGSTTQFETGTLFTKPGETQRAILQYNAPAKLPAKNKRIVALGVELQIEGKAKLMLVYNIKLVPAGELNIDGKVYDDVEVKIVGSVGGGFEVTITQKKDGTNPAKLQVSVLGFNGAGNYTLGDEEFIKRTYYLGGTVEGSSALYENYYDVPPFFAFAPGKLTISTYEGLNKFANGTFSGTLYREHKQSGAVSVTARFRTEKVQ